MREEMTTKKMQAGFTFVEVLLVVALILTLSILSTGFYARFFTQNAVTNTSDQLVSSLRKAQMYAMIGKQNGTWGVKYASNQIILFQGTTYATRNSALDEKYDVISQVSITGLNEITFSRTTGTPSATATISVSGNTNTTSITLNSQGMVNR